ncbi:unnamed protein product [Linum trigynum]|uniref:Uncharacterized protein n=1 Tax=Linum trigynum TaxID=586398 RepID=A0AAV2DTL7_9ROSI
MAQEGRHSIMQAEYRESQGRLQSEVNYLGRELDQAWAALRQERIGREQDQAALERARAEVERVRLQAERSELRRRLMKETNDRLGKALDEFYRLAKDSISRDFEDDEEQQSH